MRNGLSAFVVAASLGVMTGCPSKEGEGKDVQDPTAPNGTTSAAPVPTGPLAQLDVAKAQEEAWKTDEGADAPMLYFTNENLRISASCKQADGTLACDAIRYLRGGDHVKIAKRFLDGRQSPGVKACMRLKQPIVVLRNSVSAEDSACKFPDGSMVATGSLEQYGLSILE